MNERKLVVVVEKGMTPLHRYVGEVEHNSTGFPVARSGPEPGATVRIFNPIRVVNDEWDVVLAQPAPNKRPEERLLCRPVTFLPLSSVELREWIDIHVHRFESCGSVYARCYLAALETARLAMASRSERVVKEMEEETKNEVARAKAEASGITVVNEEEGEKVAASIADIQQRIKGGGKAS